MFQKWILQYHNNTQGEMRGLPRMVGIVLVLVVYGSCQVGRDITFEYLKLDADGDYILSAEELKDVGQEQVRTGYYNLDSFIKQVYPKYFWREFDFDKDSKIDVSELTQIIKHKWTKHAYLWPQQVNNLLTFLDQQQYFKVCDTNKDQKLDSSQFPACIHAVLTLDWNDYPWKIKSMLYSSKNVGYDLAEFKKLVIRNSAEAETLQKYATKLFQLLQWDNDKITQDHDDLIGPEEGKIMEPLYIFMLLDRNNDGELSDEEALVLLKKFGKEDALAILDMNADDKVDRNQFISYFCYASCIECSKKNQKHPGQREEKRQDSVKSDQEEL